MHEVFKIFVLSTIIISLWTAFLLLQDKRGNTLLNRWFALFLVALSAPQMSLYAEQVVQGGIFTLGLVASTFLFLKGPFVWMFIHVLNRKNLHMRKMWIHFVPWFCALAALLMFPQTLGIFVLLGMSHMLTYLLISLWRLVNMRRYVADVWQGFQNSSYYWLLYVIGGLMALVAVDFVVMSLVMLGVLNSYDLLDYFAFPSFSIFVLSIGILSVYRPELLFRESLGEHSHSATTQSTASDIQEMTEEPAGLEQKERHLELDIALAQTLTGQLTQLMQGQQIYRQNTLSLPDLALYLGISVHQVSELLNVHQGVSFYDYLNRYRLTYACGLLADPNCQLRILDIAFEAGFNNKNSFYRAFKENLGISPNQYRLNTLESTAH